MKKTPNISSFIINNNEVDYSEITKDEYFNILLKSTDIQYHYFSMYNNPYYREYNNKTGYSFESVENEINSNFTYKEREQYIKSRNEEKANKLKEEIAKLKNKISTIESKSLTEIFREIKIDNFIIDTPIDIPLVRNLLLNGYINENYNDYISIFHGINMTPQDFAFIRKVKSGTLEIFDYQLTNIAQILKKLQIRYFQYEAILNFDLFEYLLENNTIYTKQYESILELIKKETENSLEFMDGYIYKSRKQIPLFIQKLSNIWSNFWNFIYEHPTYEDKKKDHYLFLILVHANLDSIYSLNKDLKLANYIENHTRFISLFTDKDHLNKITSVINKLDMLLEKLELPDETNENLFQYIYENNHYYINIHNITLLLNKLCTGNSEGIVCWNYTTILTSNCNPLKNYIQNNLEEYLENVFLKLPNNNNESEEVLLNLLNNDNLEDKLKIRILQKQETKIKDIRDIESLSIQFETVRNNKIDATWDNIIDYYHQSEEEIINSALIEFLNIEKNYQQLNKADFTKKADDTKEFRENLVKANGLSIESYKKLIIKTSKYWNQLEFSHLDKDKVEWLVENKLNLTKDNLDLLRSYFPLIFMKLIKGKHHELITKYDQLELNIEDHIKILQSSIIPQTTKQAIIKKIHNEWIIENDKLKDLIENILSMSTGHILEYEVLEAIILYSKNDNNRLHLIYNHIEELDDEQIKTLLQMLGGKYKEIFESRKQKEFSYSILKENIFKLLKEKGMVNSYKINENKTKIKVVALYKE